MVTKTGTVALLLFTAACFQHTYHVGSGAPMGASATYDQWRHHWLWGLVSPEHEMQLSDVCPSGNATIVQEQTFLNGLVGVLTSGIYIPRTVTVRCAGGSASLDLSPDEVERIVTDASFLDWVGEVAPDRLDASVRAQDELADR